MTFQRQRQRRTERHDKRIGVARFFDGQQYGGELCVQWRLDRGRHESLVKIGPGSLKLAETNAYTGGTLIGGGTIALGINNALPTAGTVSLGTTGGNGSFDLAGFNQQVSGLAVAPGAAAANQIITNSSGSSALNYHGGASVFGGTIEDTAAMSGGTLGLTNVMQRHARYPKRVGKLLRRHHGQRRGVLGCRAAQHKRHCRRPRWQPRHRRYEPWPGRREQLWNYCVQRHERRDHARRPQRHRHDQLLGRSKLPDPIGRKRDRGRRGRHWQRDGRDRKSQRTDRDDHQPGELHCAAWQ